jgi:hypothetical protein
VNFSSFQFLSVQSSVLNFIHVWLKKRTRLANPVV